MTSGSKKMGAITAWALLVVSDPTQARTLPDQERWAHSAAATNGWALTRVFKGVSSGKSGTRGLAHTMMKQLEAVPERDRPARILMLRLERLGRGDATEAIETFFRIRRMGITVHTRLDGDVSVNKACELLMPVLRFFVGAMENEVRIDKLQANYAKRRAGNAHDPFIALSNVPPYGLRLVNGRYVAKYPECDTIRQIFALKLQGYGSQLICKRIERTAPAWEPRDGTRQPQVWIPDRIRRIIVKRTYRGTLIDAETWYRAQALIRDHRRITHRFEYPLGTALTCECGYRLVGHCGAARGNGRWRNYACFHYQNHNGHSKHHPIHKVDQQFVAILNRLDADHDLLERYVRGSNSYDERAALETKLKEVEAERAALEAGRRKVFTAFEQGDLAQRDLQWRLNELHERESVAAESRASIEQQLAIEVTRHLDIQSARELVRQAAQLWSSAQIEDQRALARAVAQAFGGLIVTADGKLLIGVDSTASLIAPNATTLPRQPNSAP